MLKITEYENEYVKNTGPWAYRGIKKVKYLRFEWDTGYLTIREDKWNKLSQKKKNLILDLSKK